MNHHLFLIGFMGAGKSTVGRILAERLAAPFIDLDTEIERLAGGVSVTEIFAAHGEEAFRALETEALHALEAAPPSVVACGGGVVLDDENRRTLKSLGRVVYLEVDAAEAIARIGDSDTRPLLQRGDATEMATTLLTAREALYRSTADAIVDTAGQDPQAVAMQVLEAMNDRVTVPVFVSGSDYEVRIGDGLLAEAGRSVRAISGAGRAALVTDTIVAPLYAETVAASLGAAGFDVVEIVVPAGEESKSWATAGEILEQLATARLGREDVLVALGGGVIGDLAGFCAATYLRGIDFVQLPTTLLAQVDSSVGGKTGVDLVAGKNLAGAFKQPRAVLADTAALATLPETEWESGLAEVAKAVMLGCAERVTQTIAQAGAIASREPDAVRDAVVAAVRHKADVVAADEHEAGLRESLNYGHTLGHAIERVAGYGAVPHGIAVAEGMRFAARLAQRVLGASPTTEQVQAELLDSLGIRRAVYPREGRALLDAMHSDKKARGGVVRFAFVPEPGVFLAIPVADEVIAEELEAWLAPENGKG